MSISDDDRAVLQRFQDALPTAGINGWAKGVDVLERLLRESLAARQPVEAVPQGCDACDRTGIHQNDEGRNICCPDCDLGNACAGDTRQPVGEPVFRDRPTHNVYRGSCGLLPCLCWADEDHILGDEVKRYAAPPALAVDLDELRRAVCVVNVVGQIDGHDVVRRNSVLDVIDNRRQRLIESRAVQS